MFSGDELLFSFHDLAVVLYVEPGADGGSFTLDAQLKSTDPFVQGQQLPKAKEQNTFEKFLEDARDYGEKKGKGWAGKQIDKFLRDDVASPLRNRIDQLIAERDPVADAEEISLLELQKSNVDDWIKDVSTNTKKVAFELFDQKSEILFPKRKGARPPKTLSEVYESKLRQPGAQDSVQPFELIFDENFDGWEGALSNVLSGNTDALEDYILSPSRVSRIGVKINRLGDNNTPSFIELGVSDFSTQTRWEDVIKRPEKNRYFLKFNLDKTIWKDLEISSSLDSSIKPEEGKNSINLMFQFELKR